MRLVDIPLSRTDVRGRLGGLTSGAMEVGQYLIAVVLTTIGVIRALGEGVPFAAAVACGVVVVSWHIAGAIFAPRANSQRLVVWWLVIFALIWGGTVAVSAEFVWLSFLLWLLAGHLFPLRWGVLFSTVVLAVVIVAPILHHSTTSYANVVGPLIGGIFAFGISRGYLQLLHDATVRERLVASLTRAQSEMAGLQDELALAQRHSGTIAERTRISRDIHDTVAQALSSIRLLAHAESTRTHDAEASRTLAHLEALAGDSLADVRRIVAALAPTELEEGTLGAALQRMLQRIETEAGLRTELHVDDSLPQLPTSVEVAILRTAQSALANTRLHADATRVVVSLVDDGDGVRMDIIDDGVGFDATSCDRGVTAESSSYGLRFMRQRLRELGGSLDIDSVPGDGTSVSTHLPIRPHSRTAGTEDTP